MPLNCELVLSAQGVWSVQQLSCVTTPVCFCGVSLCDGRHTPPKIKG